MVPWQLADGSNGRILIRFNVSYTGADTGFQSGEGARFFRNKTFFQELGTKFKKKGTKLT